MLPGRSVRTGVGRGQEGEKCSWGQEVAGKFVTPFSLKPGPSRFVILPLQLRLRVSPHVCEFSQNVEGFYPHILGNYLVI